MKAMIELKPCPFCGRKVVMSKSPIYKMYNIWHGEYAPGSCAIIEPIMIDTRVAKNFEQAASWWNMRGGRKDDQASGQS